MFVRVSIYVWTYVRACAHAYAKVRLCLSISLSVSLTGSYRGEGAGAGVLEGVEFFTLLSDAVTDEVLRGAVSEEENGVFRHVGHERRNGAGVKTAQS